jgi:hypothetical protein
LVHGLSGQRLFMSSTDGPVVAVLQTPPLALLAQADMPLFSKWLQARACFSV